MVQIRSARADHVDIGVAESSEGTGEVVKKESQKLLHVQSREESKTNMSEETSTSKYVPACLYYKTENGKSFVQSGNKHSLHRSRNAVSRQLGWAL